MRRYVDVTVEVDFADFYDGDLIDEIEARGYALKDEDEMLTADEITAILEKFQMSLPGSIGYNIYEKLRKR